ncbi:MAG: GNAT family N-acetyltransferase [Paludibacter sp.]|nr:GNAT family N-acetyltransferase [Paludibacter sp.]
MVELIKLTNETDKYFNDIYRLYEIAFPANERRSLSGLILALRNVGKFTMMALTENNVFLGFVNYWTFDRFVYIEHFAVVPEKRNKKIGSKMLNLFLSETDLPVVLEVETPKTQIAAKRINFYERQGFYLVSNFYMQPPYDGKSLMIPMFIMTNNYHFTKRHFENIKKMIYDEVYQYKNEAER